jgi:hypothetical protein
MKTLVYLLAAGLAAASLGVAAAPGPMGKHLQAPGLERLGLDPRR